MIINRKQLIIITSLIVLAIPKVNSSQNDELPKNESEVKIEQELDIKIDDIEELLISNNIELKTYKLQIAQNKNLLQSSISLWYPKLNLSSTGFPKYLDGNNLNQNDSSKDTSSKQLSASLSAEFNWELISPSRRSEINIAKENLEKAKYSYLIKLRDLKLNSLKEFYSLQQSYQDVKVAKQSVNYSKTNFNEAKIRLESGVGTKLEVLEAKTQLARDIQLLSNKLGTQKIKQRYLASVLNLPPKVTASISSPPKVKGLWELSLSESIINSFSYRKELDNILSDIAINNNNANSALSSKKPSISLYNTISQSITEGEALVKSPDMNTSYSALSNTVGIKGTWQIIDGGKAKALYKYNKNKAKEEKSKFAMKLLSIRKEVEESFYNLETAKKNILASHQAKLSAKESLRLANLRFKSGISTQREVVNQQRDLTDAEVNYTKSITNYNIFLSELQRQTGIDRIKYCTSTKNINPYNLMEDPSILKNKESDLFQICN